MPAIWKGSITFALVNIPVELKTAVRADHISFRLLHEEDLSAVRYERVCQTDGETVPWNEIVKGYEYEKGKFVVMIDEDFKAAPLEQSKTIDILDFVKQEEIDPRFFELPYYLVPGKGSEKAYTLLREVIRDALVLEIMRFANELVDPSEYDFPAQDTVRPQELQMAEQLIDNLPEPFDPSRYSDDYRAKLMKVIKAKVKGKKPKLKTPEKTHDTGVLDLMSRLRASLEEGGAKKDAVRARSKTVAATRKTAARTKKRKTA